MLTREEGRRVLRCITAAQNEDWPRDGQTLEELKADYDELRAVVARETEGLGGAPSDVVTELRALRTQLGELLRAASPAAAAAAAEVAAEHAIITRDQAIAFARQGAQQQRHAPDSADWPPQWVIDAIALAHDAGRAVTQAERDAERKQAAYNFQAGANIAAERERLHLELAAAWEAAGDQHARRAERPLAEVVRGLREKLERSQAGAESLARDLVARNQEVARLHDAIGAATEARCAALEQRLKAIGGALAGQDGDEHADALRQLVQLARRVEHALDAIEAIVAQLEMPGALARIMRRVDDYGEACAATAIATSTLPPRGRTEADVAAEEPVARRAVLEALEQELAVPRG